MDLDAISGHVLDISIRMHRELGHGLLESVYEQVLAARLERLGLRIARQRAIDIVFEGLRIEGAFRADLMIEDRLIVEIKSVERLTAVHAKQVLTYLRLTGLPLGLLVNFGGERLRDGFKRFVNGYVPSATSACSARTNINRS